MHRLDERDTRLAEMDHAPLLRTVHAVLDRFGPRYIGYNRDERLLYVDADQFAQQCVERARRARLSDPVRPGTGYARVVTLNTSQAERDEMRAQVRAIRDAVHVQLEAVAARQGMPLRDLAASLAHPLLDNQRTRDELEKDTHLLHQDLTKPIPVYRQRLSLEKEGMPGGRKKVFRWHKVLFSIEHSDFEGQMRIALERCIEEWTDDEDEREDLRAELERLMAVPNSRLRTLKKVVDTQTIGQIKKEAQIRYLEFLATAFESGHACRTLLLDLARRLRLIQRFVHDLSRSEGDYEVSYLNQPYNYRTLLSPADAFEALPVIPKVEGHLGEVTGEIKRERLYTFGMRLKLNGAVQGEGRLSSYQYHVAHLARQHPARADRKLLLLFLYSVVFDRLGDLQHDPLAAFEQQVLPVLRGFLDHHLASQCDPLYDIREQCWIAEWAQEIAPGLTLPPILWPTEVAGVVTPEASAATGIPVGTPVAVGSNDAPTDAASVGVVAPGDMMLTYGTTMFLMQVLREVRTHPKFW